ncbi:MAG: aminotransferase class V-fold PLP-dependent enzyme [Cyclobacteriaceae bacterium]
MGKLNRRNFINRALFASPILGFIPWASSPQLDDKNYPLTNNDNSENYWEDVRRKFFLTQDRIYFNTASIGASPKDVVNEMHKRTIEQETIGDTKHRLIEETRLKIAKFLNVEKDLIAITRNTTEGINLAASCLPLNQGDEIIITTHEHIGGAAPWITLKEKKGVEVKLLDLDLTGENNFEMLKRSITKKTKAVCFSHLTCTTGLKMPAKEIIAYCRQRNILSCVDGAQAVGMIDIDLNDLNPDIYAFSGHKWLYGPNGSGALYINRDMLSQLTPIFTGAYSLTEFNLKTKHFEYNKKAEMMEYGTRNAAHISALGTAFDFAQSIGIKKIEKRGRDLAQRLKLELQSNSNVELLTPIKEVFSGSIVTFKIPDLPYMELKKILATKYKIRVRGIYENDLNAIRISCGIYNSMAEIDSLVKAIRQITH